MATIWAGIDAGKTHHCVAIDESGPAMPRSTDGRYLRCALSGPQPTTVSYDGGRPDRAGARVPRSIPTISHAVRTVDQSNKPQPVRDHGAGSFCWGS